jgi:transcriptional regulator of acetoin/glycerol metabolism
VQRVLERCDWNISQAAKTLKIDRTTLYGKIKKYDLQQPRD